MRLWWLPAALLVTAVAVAGKGKKHKHQKPGRAVLDRLASTTVSEPAGASGAPSGLLPAPLDVAPYSVVEASATCGERSGVEDYCREMPAKRGIVCGVCEGSGGAPARQHPAPLAVDADPTTWWQSPTQAEGEQYREVQLMATLPALMELLHVIIKSGPSPRPLAWSLEVSISDTGDEWRLVRAFGDREHCRRLWELRPERRRRRVRRAKGGGARRTRDDKPTCSTQFTSPRPLENGQMHVPLGSGVPARRVRVSFRAAHAAPAERQYYTVRALTLAARCLCHSHAARCDVTAQGATCACEHGTCGPHCERCCDGSSWSPLAPCDVTTLDAREGCGCGARGHCEYDDTGAILCVNCTENRAGPLCDRCLPGYYTVTSDGPCLACACNAQGSDGPCKYNRKQHKVQCVCHAGVTGATCDSCVDHAAMFPYCDVTPTTRRCQCDPRGVVDTDTLCDDVCECKANVIGERCDACAAGHFGLSAGLPEGCRACYCSSITDQCVPDPDTGEHISLPVGEEAWLVSDVIGNQTFPPAPHPLGGPYLITLEVEGWDSFYWSTSTFKSGLSSYGGSIQAKLYWSVVRGDTGGNPTEGPDFIVVGRDGTSLAYGDGFHDTPGQIELAAPLTEGHWYFLQPHEQFRGDVATRSQLMNVLRDIKSLMIRAHFHWDQDEVRLDSVDLTPAPALVRETCTCPPGYSGAHCESCAWTHVQVLHVRDVTPPFECVPCACHGHASCESVDGPCTPCQHNTTGPHCERCLPGHYGNPVQGGCKPCACPLYISSNNFSPLCALSSVEEDDFVCTQCPDGYTGDRCEHCDFGYWGSPTTAGSSCQQCECGGSPCDPRSGLCLKCPPHAEGARCDQCEEGYYFNNTEALSVISCVPCACGPGALSDTCEPRGGLCACRDGWGGRTCDVCVEGHGGVAQGCPMCQCGTAALDNACDVTSGSCACAPGALPPLCDQCRPEHYGLDVSGCVGCNCSSLGSESNVCDIRSGQCRCKPHVTGRACDTCEEGYWGLTAGECQPCSCGAGAAACDPGSGACACARGVTGAHCDTCLPGFYGFGPAGCLPCPHCEEGKVCDSATGRCTCPVGAQGPHCRLCARGYWGRAPRCQRCRCGPGATSASCDSQSGECQCRVGWTGPACDACADGYFGPRCKPCGCEPAGSADTTCDGQGNCRCKENVWGSKCTICREGTFGLSVDSPTGCTACFCFGRSAHCTQAGLTRAAIHSPAPKHLTLIRGDGLRTMEQESLLAVHTDAPDATIAVPWPPVPVYIELDKRFLGDRVTSYGGMLRFKVEEEGGEELPPEVRRQFPLVRIYGRQNLVLDYYERVPPVNGTHAVRFHESLWRVRTEHGSMTASRAALMVLLQRVERVMLRVTTRTVSSTQDHVHALLLNVSLDTAIPGTSRSAPARGVELCSCPAGYSAPSCQQPALGFWMPPQDMHVTSVAGTIVIELDGGVEPCRCNGRATQCDPNNGHCLNCSSGTGGARCEVCAEGYHGHPSYPGGCQACPCPERARNFASKCAFNQGRLQCLCKPGYAGAECENCASGYKRARDGSCETCGCDTYGSLSYHCDEYGRCRCRDFATGPRCDQCTAERTFLGSEGCLPCDNCTQTLLDSISQLTSELHHRADITELSRIPKPYPALRQFVQNYTALRSQLHHYRQHKESSRTFQKEVQDLEVRADRLKHRAVEQRGEAAMHEGAANSLSLESMTGLEEVLSQRRRIAEQVLVLDEFAQGERHLSAHRALKEARRLLRAIQDLQLVDHVAAANDVFDKATLQHTSIQEHNYQIDATAQRVCALQAALAHWSRAADDVPRLADRVWDAGDEVAAVGKRAKPKLVTVRDLGLRCRLLLEDVTNLSANNLTDETIMALHRTRILAHAFPSLTSDLLTLTADAEEKEGILYNLTPVYRKKYLTSVERHVKELGRKAKEYKSLFAGTRALAAAGMGAARAWADVASALRDASQAATDALQHATQANKLARGAQPMIHAAEQAKKESTLQMRKGEDVLKRAEELRTTLEHLRRGAERVGVALRGLGWQERELAARPRADVSDTLAHASVQADRVFSATRVLYDEASELRRRGRYHLRRQLAELQKHGDTQLGAAQEHVSQISGNTLRAIEVAGALADAAAARAREHRAADKRLTPDTQTLRDKIARARHAADSISVSVTSKSGSMGCARAYRLTSSSSSVTRISFAISFDGTVRDGPLIYLSSDDNTPSYLKLFVEDGRLKLAWDLGDGEGRIESQEPLEATHDDADHTSYRMEIERVWNTVKLTIDRAGGSTQTLTNTTSGPHVTLRPLRLWLGAPPQAAPGSAGLPGCAHALYYDDRRVGLWDFVEQPKEAQCSGCTQRWYNSVRSGEPSLVWFNGEGYSELHRSGFRPSDRRSFSLAFVFRTRDEDAALFVTRDTSNNRSLSVVMRSCRVVLRVEYSSSALEITAPGRHCHGRVVHVQAIRVFAGNRLEKGSLRVNGEETLGSPEPPVQSPAALPDLAAASYWVGGTPPGSSFDAPPMLGCLGALTVDREGYDPLDTPTRHGVEPRCGTRTLRSATSEGSGYIELGAPTLRRKAALGLSFRARGPSGLLLYRPPSSLIAENEVDDDDDGDNKHYLALILADGQLDVVIAAGKAELRMRTNGTRLDDGRLHAVRLIRVHKQLELWVDSARASSSTLPGNALPARSRGFFLAGLPEYLKSRESEVKNLKGFTGTIADLIVDGTLIGLESAVNWSGVRLGRADREPHNEPRTEPRALQAQPATTSGCTKTSSYTVEPGAVKFGDAPWSHATLRAAAAARASRGLALALQLRTFQQEGLLLLVPGSKTKPRHYLALLLREGKLRLIVRGRRRRELSLATTIADGTWRSVSVRVSNSRLVLASGGAAATAKAPRKVGLAGRIYVGGIPDRVQLPNIPDSIVRVGGFRGCVRRVVINGRAEDLVRDAASHHRVSQCFPSVEPGAHFAGDAHAIWSSTWSSVGSSELAAEVRVQFRTSEPSGVLLAATHFVLELKDGKVMLTRRSSSGSELSRVETLGIGERALCDDTWHVVVARVTAAVTLTLDGGPELRGAGPGLLDDVTDAPVMLSPLYVGGLPEGVTDNTSGGGGKENFKGCLRDVTVGGEKRDWTDMEALHNVLLDSCPIPQ